MRLADIEMILAFVCCVIIELTSGQALANSLAQQQQQQANASLPALTERANGLNSRYLSAGSTASLAAATVAAANQTPLQQQQSSSQQHQSGHQHQNQHSQQAQQQQQQQQPQQVASPPSGLHSSQTQLNGLAQQPAQYNTPAAHQTAPQALASPQGLVAGAPVMTSTFAFSPLTGQYGPADSSSFLSGYQQQAAGFLNQPFISQQSSNNYYPQQQQQQQLLQQTPFFQQQLGPFAQNGFGAPSSRLPQRLGQSFYQTNQLASQQQQQPSVGRYPQQTSFTRRNGQQALGIGSRNANSYLLGANSNGANQLIDDDSNGLFQQQQVSSVSLADQLAASLGLNLDPSYVANQNNGYLQSNNNDQQAAGFTQQQPASVGGSFVGGSVGQSSGASGVEQHRGHEQCVAADGRHGTCYQASECIRRGGTPMGRCGASQSFAGLSNTLSELSGASHVCCLFDVTCGQFAAERFVYFRNPGYPNTFDQSRMCRAKIGKLDKGVCQLRLDLTRFDIGRPSNGNCSQDVFVVSGQNENYVVPKICGLNDGQHYYVGVDESGVITLHMMMMGLYRRSFEILITQIPCRSDFAAPAHCLQYYMGTHGTIKSFNYDDELAYGNAPPAGAFVNYDLQQEASSMSHQLTNGGSPPYGLQFPASAANNNNNNNNNQQLQQRQQPIYAAAQQASGGAGSNRYAGSGGADFGATALSQFGGYPNDLDYTICIRKESGFCSITYQLSRADQGGLSPFAVGHSLFGHNETAAFGASSGGWNSVSTECRDDYLLIGGVRLCSANSPSGSGSSSSLYEQTVQFANQQSNSNSNSNNNFSNQQQQMFQQQQNSLMQQLARLQQQQAALAVGANATQSSPGQQQQQQQQGANTGSGNNNFAAAANLEQQQAAIVQQLMLIQQQMNGLATSGQQQAQFNSRPFHDNSNQFGQAADLQAAAIITDTTSGPFLLRFVSNTARNARGFHIDYRQNPCK